jgi:TatD DNase family protein
LNQLAIDNRKSIIENRLLLETDAPYMAPVPHRGERNESRFMTHVADRLAQTLGTTPSDIIATTSSNARRLFGI